jgi:hypothetical protein
MATTDDNVLTPDIYVEVTLRAMRNGAVWNEIKADYPGQSEASYYGIEHVLSEALKGLGAAKGQDVLLQKDGQKPKG